jgi:hypothetical protein
MSKPDDNLSPQQQEEKMQGYCDALIQRFIALNVEFSQRP